MSFLSWARSVGFLRFPPPECRSSELAPRPNSGDEAAGTAVTMQAPSECAATLTREQVRRRLEQALSADPDLARLLLQSLVGTVIPLEFGALTQAEDIKKGTFGTSPGTGTPRTYTFLPDDATTVPVIVKGAASQSADLTQWQNSAAAVLAVVKSDGKLALGATDRLSKLTVKGKASFPATGTVSVTNGSATVTGSSTKFLSEVGIGDRVTVVDVSQTRTVVAISSDTSLTVDAAFTAGDPSSQMTVFPSLFRCDDSSSTPTPKFIVNDEGFVGLAGTRVNDNDGVGYVISNLDIALVDKNNEMRGYQGTMRYTRTTADANISGEGWDVLSFVGAVSLENMNLPSSDTELRGQMKPFQSELRFEAAVGPAGNPRYSLVAPALNYVASLFRVHSTCTINTWAGYFVDSPCCAGGAASKVTNGYGIWINDLDDADHTLVKDNAAAIRIDGFNEYSRILWTNCSVYCPTSGILEFKGDPRVQTASGVDFRVGRTLLLGAATGSKQVSGGPELITGMQTASNNIVLWAGISTDTEGRYMISASGLNEWGPGGMGDQDMALFRNAAGNLTVQSFNTNSTEAFRVNASSTGTGTEVLGVDTVSLAVRAKKLWVNGAGGGATLDVAGSAGLTAFRVMHAAAGDTSFSTGVAGDSFLRFAFLADGTMKWGPGTAVGDVQLYRPGTRRLAIVPIGGDTDATFIVATSAGTTVLSVDTSNQRVGVGNITPQEKLDVDGNVNVAGGYRVGGAEVISSGKVVKGNLGGCLLRFFSQNTRPTLETNELANWFRPSDGLDGMLYLDGSNYWWWRAASGGAGEAEVNP